MLLSLAHRMVLVQDCLFFMTSVMCEVFLLLKEMSCVKSQNQSPPGLRVLPDRYRLFEFHKEHGCLSALSPLSGDRRGLTVT
jgi:hypothetical protein